MHLIPVMRQNSMILNIPNSCYEIGEVRSVNGKYVSTVKVFGVYYAEKYNTDVDYDHVLA